MGSRVRVSSGPPRKEEQCFLLFFIAETFNTISAVFRCKKASTRKHSPLNWTTKEFPSNGKNDSMSSTEANDLTTTTLPISSATTKSFWKSKQCHNSPTSTKRKPVITSALPKSGNTRKLSIPFPRLSAFPPSSAITPSRTVPSAHSTCTPNSCIRHSYNRKECSTRPGRD